ncbi:hypothetical protein EVAR_26596_1 [Eumeta japonica]|uniref:Uncharacterized protein n=1 Tax=Eumeta variegata TaxID=151549 RepID=A0A4C1W5H6_EUMVA|nr:hypothetical protein EVAR_26596_1 [Eumeta japonica]
MNIKGLHRFTGRAGLLANFIKNNPSRYRVKFDVSPQPARAGAESMDPARINYSLNSHDSVNSETAERRCVAFEAPAAIYVRTFIGRRVDSNEPNFKILELPTTGLVTGGSRGGQEINKVESQQESYNGVWLAFHDEAPFLVTVNSWFNEFKRGCTNLAHDLREGRPSTVTTEDNISAVCLRIETKKGVTKAGFTVTVRKPKIRLAQLEFPVEKLSTKVELGRSVGKKMMSFLFLLNVRLRENGVFIRALKPLPWAFRRRVTAPSQTLAARAFNFASFSI